MEPEEAEKAGRDLKRAALVLLGCILGVVLGSFAGVSLYNLNHPRPSGSFVEIQVVAKMMLIGGLIGLLSGAVGGYLAGRRLVS